MNIKLKYHTDFTELLRRITEASLDENLQISTSRLTDSTFLEIPLNSDFFLNIYYSKTAAVFAWILSSLDGGTTIIYLFSAPNWLPVSAELRRQRQLVVEI